MPTKIETEEISKDFPVKTWGAKERPWGYEVRVDVTDLATGRIYNEVMVFKDKAGAVDLKAALQQVQARIKAQVAEAATKEKSSPVCALCGRPL